MFETQTLALLMLGGFFVLLMIGIPVATTLAVVLAYWLFSLARPHLGWLPHPDGSRRCKDRCETRP